MTRRMLPWALVAAALSLPLAARPLGTTVKSSCNPYSTCVPGGALPCCFVTNCVTCGFTLTGLGNVTKTDGVWALLGCGIAPEPAAGVMAGLALCMNPGGNMPPGLQPASVSASWDAEIVASADKNGKVIAKITASAPDAVLAELVASGACPNPNYTVTDFIPCTFQGKLTGEKVDPLTGQVLLDKNGEPILVVKTYACELPSCTTLGYDAATGVEKRTYACSCVQQCDGTACGPCP